MSKQLQDKVLRGEARIVEAPDVVVARDRSFGLPSALYGTTVACYLGFLAVMFASFANPLLIIPMVIFGVFIAAGFGVPAIWTRMKGNDSQPLTMGQFEANGIMTNTGRLAPRDATVQVLLLPALVFGWGLAVATVVAFVA